MFSFYGRDQTAAGEGKLPCTLRNGISKAGWPFRVALSWGWEAGPSHPHVANSLIAGHPRRGHDRRWGDSSKEALITHGVCPLKAICQQPFSCFSKKSFIPKGVWRQHITMFTLEYPSRVSLWVCKQNQANSLRFPSFNKKWISYVLFHALFYSLNILGNASLSTHREHP